MTDGILALADLERLTSRYRSKAEEWWGTFGEAILADELGQEVVVTAYEPVTLHMPGNDYTPDFMHVLANGWICFVEVKAPLFERDKAGKRAFRGKQNMRDARSKLREAAETFPYFRFIEVRKFGTGAVEIEQVSSGRPP
jgi:hypothetical protein